MSEWQATNSPKCTTKSTNKYMFGDLIEKSAFTPEQGLLVLDPV